KVAPSGKSVFHRFNPFWTQFSVSRHDEIGITRMAVQAQGRNVTIGSFLNPDDRESFAVAFARALARAKARSTCLASVFGWLAARPATILRAKESFAMYANTPMNHRMSTLPQPVLEKDITPQGDDYTVVRRVIEKISLDYREQPSLEDLAEAVGETPTGLQKLFTRWAGLSPKAFLQAVTLDHARRLLDSGMPLLETAFELGMSGPGRLHDLCVTHEAMSPGDYKNRGAGLTIRYGYHISPFGIALVMVTDRGLAGLAFADPGGEAAALADMRSRWRNASYV